MGYWRYVSLNYPLLKVPHLSVRLAVVGEYRQLFDYEEHFRWLKSVYTDELIEANKLDEIPF